MARKVRVVNVSEVNSKNVKPLLREAADSKNGLLVGNAAYRELAKLFRANGLVDVEVSADPVTGYTNVREWTSPGSRVKIIVEYRQPMYTNSVGNVRKGKRVRISA